MKTLDHHTLLYDDECPMCSLYTGAFVKSGMLDARGREAFSKTGADLISKIDVAKAKDEIALVNRATGEVQYGIDSLFSVIGHSLPVFKPLFNLKLFRWLIKSLYSFISYNRKVIAPGQKFEAPGSCTPSLNLSYRVAYLLLAWLSTSLVLNRYAGLLVPIIPSPTIGREFMICGGQIFFQVLLVGSIRRERVIHYLGNMMTISLIGALLLLPMVWIGQIIHLQSAWIYFVWFLAVAIFMVKEHSRRIKILELPGMVTAGWIIYGLLVLLIVVE